MGSAPPYPRFDGSQPCRDVDPESFFPKTPQDSLKASKAAARVCAGCPFLDACREYAIAHDVQGFWGGLTEQERREERKRRGITPVRVRVSDAALRRMEIEDIDDGVRPAAEVAIRVGCSIVTVLRARRDRSEVA